MIFKKSFQEQVKKAKKKYAKDNVKNMKKAYKRIEEQILEDIKKGNEREEYYFGHLFLRDGLPLDMCMFRNYINSKGEFYADYDIKWNVLTVSLNKEDDKNE